MLIRLFSESKLLLKDVEFNPGLNVVLGKYSKTREARGVNGIGKSTLVRLINYCFLSDSSEKIFQKDKYNFLREESHNIILEFQSQGKRYFIKRFFNEKDKVHFGEKFNDLQVFTRAELKAILTNKLFPLENNASFFQGNRFGTLMHFFVKDDIEHQQRIDPIKFLPYAANLREISIYNFYLMNLPTKNIIEYDQLMQEYEKNNDVISALEEKAYSNTGKRIEELKSERFKVQDKVALLEKSLKDYQFLEAYKDAENGIVDLTTKINDKLKDYHSINRKLKKLRDSYHFDQALDTKKVQNIYNEAVSTFGDMVKRSLDEVQIFKKELLENRNKFLVSSEAKLEKNIQRTLSEISILEEERSRLYKRLDEKGALDSITNTIEEVAVEKSKLELNLQVLKQIESIQESLSNLDVSISQLKRDMLNNLKDNDVQINELRAWFQEILKNAIYLGEDFSKAYFDIKIRAKSTRAQLPFQIEVEIPKTDALGQERLKIVVYDFMVFLKSMSSKRNIPDFLIHDGVFHGIATKTKINTLNFMYHESLKNPNFQYLVTFNEDEILLQHDKEEVVGKLDFDITNLIVAQYEDEPTKMIFKKAFD